MKKELKEILLKYRNINEAIEKIEDLYVNRTDQEKIKLWRDKYYVQKRTNESLSAKFKSANLKLIEIHKIMMKK